MLPLFGCSLIIIPLPTESVCIAEGSVVAASSAGTATGSTGTGSTKSSGCGRVSRCCGEGLVFSIWRSLIRSKFAFACVCVYVLGVMYLTGHCDSYTSDRSVLAQYYLSTNSVLAQY